MCVRRRELFTWVYSIEIVFVQKGYPAYTNYISYNSDKCQYYYKSHFKMPWRSCDITVMMDYTCPTRIETIMLTWGVLWNYEVIEE